MTGNQVIEDRRHEPRQSLPKAVVAWRRHGNSLWHRGWLNDISRSGASLLSSTQGQPHAGQEIELRLAYNGEVLLCRVVRTQIREDEQNLVACRVISADGCRALLRPGPNAGAARQQALRKACLPGVWVDSPHDMACRKSA
jgi:hypothetical protein